MTIKMTIVEQVKYILRKHRETRMSRSEFMWLWCETFLGAKNGLTKEQFKKFWESEPSLERELRRCLQLDEFKLPLENDAVLQEKKSNFQRWHKNLKKKEQKKFDKIFDTSAPTEDWIKKGKI